MFVKESKIYCTFPIKLFILNKFIRWRGKLIHRKKKKDAGCTFDHNTMRTLHAFLTFIENLFTYLKAMKFVFLCILLNENYCLKA